MKKFKILQQINSLVGLAALLDLYVLSKGNTIHIVRVSLREATGGNKKVTHKVEYIAAHKLISVYNKGVKSKFYPELVDYSASANLGILLKLPRIPLTIQRNDLRMGAIHD